MAASKPRALWTGTISFGMIHVPVKLYTAVREKQIHFRMLHDADSTPLQMRMVCPKHGEVHREHIIKGLEISKDHYVIVNQEELSAANPQATRMIEIQDFVDADSIDPMYYDRAYYLGPGPGGAHAYKVLVEALKRTRKSGIAQFVMRGTEYLAAVRVRDDVLTLETMYFDKEVAKPDEVKDDVPHHKVQERELKIAQMIVESLAKKFDPNEYEDDYVVCVEKMVEKKARGEEIVIEKPERKSKDIDLMSALEASLEHVKSKASQRSGRGNGHRRSA